MQAILKRLALMCAGSLLLACAGPATRAPSDPGRAADAEQAYLIGRSYHMALRPQLAMSYYRTALRAAPSHLNARNGLAVLYAEQGQIAHAIALWEELTASQPGSSLAYLFSNLGYAHLLQGQPARALAPLEQACLLDPLSERAWQHLGDALAKTGQHTRAEAMHKQAASLRGHDLRADLAAAAVAKDADNAVPAEPDWAQTEISEGAGGTFVLRRIDAARTVQPQQAVPQTPAVVQAGARPLLEIRNGNGVTGMARALARSLGEGDPQVVRLSNEKGYGVRRTRVEYQPAFRTAAERLAERVGAEQVVPAAQPGRADLRLVLGRDLARPVRAAVAALHNTPAHPG